jgi:hypothetical protein
MDWRSIGAEVAKAAPILGALLSATPAGAVISGAGALIASVLGVEPTPGAINAALADPASLVRLREIEARHAEELQRLVMQAEANRIAADTAELQTAAADRADARDLAAKTNSNAPAILAMVITGGFFGVLSFMIGTNWTPTDNPSLLLLMGALSTSWGSVVNYFFGTSAGSARKDLVIAAGRRASDKSP